MPTTTIDSSEIKKTNPKTTRTKTGCITCRIRRVKCDEIRPACKRCTSTGRKCDGWTDVPTSRRDLVVATGHRRSVLLSCQKPSSTIGFSTATEHQYFDFFRSKTSPGTNHLFGCDFWSRGVLQLCHSEPAIKHAVLAISALHQNWDLYGSSVVDIDKNAIQQYGKAVISAKELLVKSQVSYAPDRELVQKVLTACILFICFENLMCDYGSAALHLRNGLQILDQHSHRFLPDSGSSGHIQFEDEIKELLQRYHFQAMTFAQAKFPYRQAAERFQKGPPDPLPESFDTMSRVRGLMFEKLVWIMSVGEVRVLSLAGIPQHAEKSCEQLAEEARIENEKAIGELQLWWTLFDDFVVQESYRTGSDFRLTPIYNWIAAYHQLALVVALVNKTGLESDWDMHTASVEFIVEKCDLVVKSQESDSTFSLELGVCIPLWIVATRCRHPEVRRKAIKILDGGNRKEGIWETHPAARVGERIMMIEENEARFIRAEKHSIDMDTPLLNEQDIPGEARIQNMFTEVDLPAKWAKIRCIWEGTREGRPTRELTDSIEW